MDTVKLMRSDAEIMACYPVMVQLRPHIAEEGFLPQVRAQMTEGYQLAALSNDERIASVAGFRLGSNLAWGRFLYVDDLVTEQAFRSQGLGQTLLHWLYDYGRDQGCSQLHLDSGLQRLEAHRFYQLHGMDISGHHFVRVL